MDQQISTFEWEGGSQIQNISVSRPSHNAYGETITPLLPIIDEENSASTSLHAVVSPQRDRGETVNPDEEINQILVNTKREIFQLSLHVQREINKAQAFITDSSNQKLLERYSQSLKMIQQLSAYDANTLPKDQAIQFSSTLADLEGKSQQLRYEYMQSPEYRAYRQKIRDIGQTLHDLRKNLQENAALPDSMRESIFSFSPSDKIDFELDKIKSFTSKLAVLNARLVHQPADVNIFFNGEKQQYMSEINDLNVLLKKRIEKLEESALLLPDYYINPPEKLGPVAVNFDLRIVDKHIRLLEKFLKNPTLFEPNSLDQFKLGLKKAEAHKKFLESYKSRTSGARFQKPKS